MDEYFLFQKRRLPRDGAWGLTWDVAISAFNSSERVRLISQKIAAQERYWFLFPEYEYTAAQFPQDGAIIAGGADDEAQLIADFLGRIPDLAGKRVVIDITGFINHYVLVLIPALARMGIANVDILYGEPVRYLHGERTRFTDEAVINIRQVSGYEGVHRIETARDLLAIAVGYDFRLVAEIANHKDNARKVQMFGLPSLRPDMYQEGLLRASRVAEAMGPDAAHPHHFRFAPAQDPFITASVLSDIVRQHRSQNPEANIYLSPLSTKSQALGFAIYYLRECLGSATSIVYPFCKTSMKETSQGLSGAWLYQVEIANLMRAGAGSVI